MNIPHCFVDRSTGKICRETFLGDQQIRILYSTVRENAPGLFRMLTSPRATRWMSRLVFDLNLLRTASPLDSFLKDAGIDLNECLEPQLLRTYRDLFERKIKYWQCRPMPEAPARIVSPADGRLIVGSFLETSCLFLKGKFFDLGELLGMDKCRWHDTFSGGDFAIFRLTPEKYHYNHTPVSGIVSDIYRVNGSNHSCNPSVLMEVATPLSKNERIVTIINTDVPGGSRAGFVAMVEITAMMIGRVVQCYSTDKYENPQSLRPGAFLERGCPKSLYKPGSSTDVLLFQKGRVTFDSDILANMNLRTCSSRFSAGLGRPLVETDVPVRSGIALATYGASAKLSKCEGMI